MTTPPPLTGIRVLEFAGLAPGPFAGILLADYGATVLRVDRAQSNSATPTPDLLSRRKSSIAVDFKSTQGIALIRALISHVDVVIDPFRPGVLEKLGLGPEDVLLSLNPRLVVGRITGFRRDGKYAQMAGHDINYIGLSGVLSMLGRATEAPYPPANILGDFAGGGAMCFLGIVLALYGRTSSGKGQVVEANMVDGSAYLATMPRLAIQGHVWNHPRGENLLDGGCPFYDVYETKDGGHMAVGSLEPQFFSALLQGLGISPSSLPGPREDRRTWPALRALFTGSFRSRTRQEWEAVFDGSDACVTPVRSHQELNEESFDQRPAVTLKHTPALAIHRREGQRNAAEGQGPGVEGDGWTASVLVPGQGGDALLASWLGWKRGKDFDVQDGGLVKIPPSKL